VSNIVDCFAIEMCEHLSLIIVACELENVDARLFASNKKWAVKGKESRR
jgi:hypothetical protein